MDMQSATADTELPGWESPGAFWMTRGLWEVNTTWVSEFADDVTIVDVRGADEYTGPLGHIRGSELVPLHVLGATALQRLDRSKPIVTVCRSGGRSLSAAGILDGMGFERVASMAGGMMAWNNSNLPVE